MFSSQPQQPAPDVLTCPAGEVQPGDEVVIVDPDGVHHVVRPEYLVIDPARTSVRMVPRDGPEGVVRYEDAVMVVRGEGLSRVLPRR
jgi:hypothetical protein